MRDERVTTVTNVGSRIRLDMCVIRTQWYLQLELELIKPSCSRLRILESTGWMEWELSIDPYYRRNLQLKGSVRWRQYRTAVHLKTTNNRKLFFSLNHPGSCLCSDTIGDNDKWNHVFHNPQEEGKTYHWGGTRVRWRVWLKRATTFVESDSSTTI